MKTVHDILKAQLTATAILVLIVAMAIWRCGIGQKLLRNRTSSPSYAAWKRLA